MYDGKRLRADVRRLRTENMTRGTDRLRELPVLFFSCHYKEVKDFVIDSCIS